MNGRVLCGSELNNAIRSYVRAYVLWHGRQRAAETLGVSRQTLWRFLERGHLGRAVPCAVKDAVGGSVQVIEAAARELVTIRPVRSRVMNDNWSCRTRRLVLPVGVK